MRTNKDIEFTPYLFASSLGKAREHLYFRDGKQMYNKPQDKVNEIFCVYESKNGSKAFWMERTPMIEKFFAQVFQARRSNQHIHFYEWSDRINCSVEDGIYISHTNFFMTKEEFAKFLDTIVPYDEYYKEE